jgi:predicted DNA-binding protein with PD1-like motif
VGVAVLGNEETIPYESIQSTIDHEKGILMGRLTNDIDLLEGILSACKKHGITAGSVSCIGSLKKVTLVQLSIDDGKLDYTKPIVWEYPVELLSGTGFIGYGFDEEVDLHFHGTYVNHKGEISGGHFLKGKNPTAVTIEFVVHFSDKMVLQRQKDLVWDLPVFQFSSGGGK